MCHGKCVICDLKVELLCRLICLVTEQPLRVKVRPVSEKCC